MKRILEMFPLDNCGATLKGLLKFIFAANVFLIIVAYILVGFGFLFVEFSIGLLILLFGWIGVLVEIAAVYVSLLPLGCLAEISINTAAQVEVQEESNELLEAVAEPKTEVAKAAPAKAVSTQTSEKIPAWKRVEMEKAGIPVPQPVAEQPNKIVAKEMAEPQAAQGRFDTQKIPAWKRVQMEKEQNQQ